MVIFEEFTTFNVGFTIVTPHALQTQIRTPVTTRVKVRRNVEGRRLLEVDSMLITVPILVGVDRGHQSRDREAIPTPPTPCHGHKCPS